MAAAAPGKVKFTEGDYFWCPDDTNGFYLLKCLKAFTQGEATEGGQLDGSKVSISAAQSAAAEITDRKSVETLEDMVKLPDLREASILHNLRERFRTDDIYTRIGTILVSVNPFKMVNMYSPDILEAYTRAGDQTNDSGNSVLPPHIYQLADQAYRNLVSLQESQACLVSGESGAGKTEATKILLQFLAEMSARTASEDWGEQGRLQEQILKANPLMEAFGNAKTVRNNNSSRFGKYIEVKFNARMGTIVGGTITQYLLEKSRIVYQSPKERNYHIFYQICAGAQADNEIRKKYRLHDADQYKYLMDPKASEGINDDRGWEETLTALTTLNMSPSERDDVMRTVAGVLHMGNLKFKEVKKPGVDQACEVENKDELEIVAFQLGLTPEELDVVLCSKKLVMGSGNAATTTVVYFNIKQAEDVRDAVAKSVYGNMFDWLIKRINWALSTASKSAIVGQQMALHQGGGAGGAEIVRKESKVNVADAIDPYTNLVRETEQLQAQFVGQTLASIGVLDIFGFEAFEINSFEQLCINYCNEKLQGFFTEHIFKLEQAEYVAEGLSLTTITFKDNAEIIDMLEKKRTGLFAMMDEEMTVPRGSDESLLSKIVKAYGTHPNYRKNLKDAATKFGVLHFAGEVQYTINGFLDKNRDQLPKDVETCLQKSQQRYLRALFPITGGTADVGGAKKSVAATVQKKSLSFQFCYQLDALMHTLKKASPHFIRCVKPNKVLKGDVFDGVMVLEQLRYAGLLEVCKIRKQGFPIRREHAYFQWRFGILLGKGADAARGRLSAKNLAEALVAKKMLQSTEWVCGKTKLFLKNEAFDRLEKHRSAAVDSSAVAIQSIVRGKLGRAGLKNAKAILKKLEVACKTKDAVQLEELLLETANLYNQGRHLPQVKAARKMMQQVEEERRVERLLVEAIQAEELDSLVSSLQAATSLGYSSPSVKKGQDLVEELKKLKLVKADLDVAVATRDLAKIRAAVALVSLNKRVQPTDASLLRAKTLMQRLEEEATAVNKLMTAIASKQPAAVKDAIEAMNDMGMSAHPLIAEGMKITKEIVANASQSAEKFKKKIEDLVRLAAEAADHRDFAMLEDVQNQCFESGITSGAYPKIDAALKVLMEMNKLRGFAGLLSGARKALAVKAARSNGLQSEADLKELKDAVDQAKANGSTEANDTELKIAVDALARAQKQLLVQKVLNDTLADAVAMKDYIKLKQVMEQCEGLEMNTVESFTRVKDVVLQLEMKQKSSPAQMTMGQRLDVDIVDEATLEKRNKEKLIKAASPGYKFDNYFRLRSDADFAKGIMFNKGKTKKMAYQDDPVHKSLIEFPVELSRQAVRLNRSILGYCGDVVMSFPASLAQDLVDRCLTQPQMCDEVYLQLCKHITENPENQSLGRAWQLMCICVGAFPPSLDFEPYLLNFLQTNEKNKGIIGQYAKYALRKLQSTLAFGPSENSVSIEEIEAYGDRPPMMATVTLVDGTPVTKEFPVPPHFSVDDVMRICSEFLALKDQRADLFGIFVKESDSKKRANIAKDIDTYFDKPTGDSPESMPMPDGVGSNADNHNHVKSSMDDEIDDCAPRTVFPLQLEQHLGDVVLNMTRRGKMETFVFRRKFFLSNNEKPGTDPVFNRLLYLQILDEFITGNWYCPREQIACDLVAISFAIDLGEDMPTSVTGLLDEGLMEYVPASWQDRSPEFWATYVLKKRAEFVALPVSELELLFIQISSQELPTYGSTMFYVRTKVDGSDFALYVDWKGFRLMSLKKREFVLDIPYESMKKFSGTSKMLSVELLLEINKPYMFYTSQAKEIAALMVDYTNMMAVSVNEGNGMEGSVPSALRGKMKTVVKTNTGSEMSVTLQHAKKQRDFRIKAPTEGGNAFTTGIKNPPMKPHEPNKTLAASEALLGVPMKKGSGVGQQTEGRKTVTVGRKTLWKKKAKE